MEKRNHKLTGSGGNRSNTRSSEQRTKILGGNKVELGGVDASRLIGSIIEKGVTENVQSSSPTPPPKVTVLPFPVARHRSHGPHWDSVGSTKGKDNGNDDSEGDEEDDTDTAYAIAAFATQVKRKQKKGLDLSRWKELATDDYLARDKVEEHMHLGKTDKIRKDEVKNVAEEKAVLADLDSSVPMEMDLKLNSASSGNEKGRGNGTAPVNKSHSGVGLTPCDAPADLKSSNMAKVSSSRPTDFGNEQGSPSLEYEIDAENRARLQTMTADEIAQAQAELMEKMDPALLNLLKRRGQNKKQNDSSSGPALDVDMRNAQNQNPSVQDAKVVPQIEKDVSHLPSGQGDKDAQSSGQARGVLWNAWTDRVEAVRNLRFSLDGSVISHDVAPELNSGYSSPLNSLNANTVAERDYLRSEGDPGAAGYTIKEAVALTRSMISGQRALALNLVAAVLDKALHNICRNQGLCAFRNDQKVDRSIDWEAVWAYALGPEPELILSLRISLDDNHDSVVLAGLKVIHRALSCDLNDNFFDMLEKIPIFEKNIYTAPVFRSKPAVDLGFLHGGYWKYNAKPSNILLNGDDLMDDETEEKRTIKDDIYVGGQDFAAGLVRMGLLERLRYLLETNCTSAMEDFIVTILIAIARHSPTCADAIMECERLIQTVVHRFTVNKDAEGQLAKIKSVCLIKVLARSDKKKCIEFIESGVFQAMTLHLYLPVSSLEQWLKLGKEHFVFSSSLMVEQLRLWKVCIQYGYCLSYFPHIFPALCLWLNPPSFEKLIKNNILGEFASILTEVFLVFDALAVRLPKFYSQGQPGLGDPDTESWYWDHIEPIVDSAVSWLASKNYLYGSKYFESTKGIHNEFISQDLSLNPLLWAYSSIMLFLTRILEKVTPEDSICLPGGGKDLPDFVHKVGLQIIKSGFWSFSEANVTEYSSISSQGSSFLEELCHFRRQADQETSIATVSCLYGLVQVVSSIDNLMQLAKSRVPSPTLEQYDSSREEKVLEESILKESLVALRSVTETFIDLVASEWRCVQSIEIFGRGGPAPGVGTGWGAFGGGFWSPTILLAQTDIYLLVRLLEIFQTVSPFNIPTDEDMSFSMQCIAAILGICLIAGPTDKVIVQKALDIVLQGPILKSLDSCTRRLIQSNRKMKSFGWEYEEEDYLFFSRTLISHFTYRWLSVKQKSKASIEDCVSDNKNFKKGATLDTIHEDVDPSNIDSQNCRSSCLTAEWAHQRLPLPMHWFLSPISTICNGKESNHQSFQQILDHVQESHVPEVAKSGLFFLLGIEALSWFLRDKSLSPIQSVPLFWKLHSLSVILLAGMGVLEEERSKDTFEALQEYYGQLLDKAWSSRNTELDLNKDVNTSWEAAKISGVELLRFQTEIHESYSTFIEALVEQFAAVSYGDIIYGRQVAVYLHCCVEAPVRLATLKALTTAHVLELLPPLEKCFSEAEGYLEPIEENEEILEAYVKAWTSGALDKAVTRGTMVYTLILHHLSSFIFFLPTNDKLAPRNKLVKSLLRDSSRQKRHERMMLDLIQYSKPLASQMFEHNGGLSLQQIEKRFEILKEACEGNSSLLTEVEKLKSCLKN